MRTPCLCLPLLYTTMYKYICSHFTCVWMPLLKCTFCRNLRIREDTAKYLLDLDVNSAHYDPKSRSMREDPMPDADPSDQFYGVSSMISIPKA